MSSVIAALRLCILLANINNIMDSSLEDPKPVPSFLMLRPFFEQFFLSRKLQKALCMFLRSLEGVRIRMSAR